MIGKNGETIKALQTYTGALIQIDQVGPRATTALSQEKRTCRPLRLCLRGLPAQCRALF